MLSLPGQTLIMTGAEGDELSNAEVVRTALDGAGRIALDAVLGELGRRQCNDVLVEAGPTLSSAFIEAGLADELVLYLAPVLLGPDARAMTRLRAIEELAAARRYADRSACARPD
jgi:diaminohydroxyphosphoribosylaminopyrimidine deaminase/5-amino-6-(5-phosphoribosylamino)uracil reductase